MSRQTLYAYVSRGRIGVTAAPDDPRRSLYDAADVRRLAERNRSGRSRRAVAASTISWGEPILVSAITRIQGGRLEYRGKDAIALSGDCDTRSGGRAAMAGGRRCRGRGHIGGWPRARAAAGVAERCIAAMADLAMAGRWTGRVENVLPDAVRILDRMAWAAAGLPGVTVQPSALPLHDRLASAWGVGPKGADLIRRALVLTADHELNASTYATRVVASTRAPLGACVLAGLTALIGPLHGGMTNEVRHLLAIPSSPPIPQVPSRSGWRAANGFLRSAIRSTRTAIRVPLRCCPAFSPSARARHLIEAMQSMTGILPNIDFALLMLEERLRLPTGAAFAVFAVGRTVGWIAHALEQWRDGTLIRPRAVYPEAGSASDRRGRPVDRRQ